MAENSLEPREPRHHRNARKITHRLYISGDLVLCTPAHFGSGQVREEALTDMSLLRDEEEQRPLIPGTTIAGALRNYLRSQVLGYSGAEPRDSRPNRSVITRLFGPTRTSGETESRFQSQLIVDDALGRGSTTLRDGVRIDFRTRTAYSDDSGGAKFDVELLEPGTRFQLNFELLLTEDMGAAKVLPALMAALDGLEKGEIRLGLRKRRGYGRCQVEGWHVRTFDLRDPNQLCDWLESPTLAPLDEMKTAPIRSLLAEFNLRDEPPFEDQRNYFDISAKFSLHGSSLLIRSGFGEADTGPDMVHLHSVDENGNRVPVIPGTSWAGVLRHRALRIVNTIKEEDATEQALVERMFGSMPKDKQKVGAASRLVVDETRVHNGQSLYQTRVRIDRFTGGALETALFEQAPIYGKADTTVDFHVRLLDPEDHEKGLLLLLLKDMWTQDLPVGGESSVGRGRLRGIEATITDQNRANQTSLRLDQNGDSLGLTTAQRQSLQGYVDALWKELDMLEEATGGEHTKP